MCFLKLIAQLLESVRATIQQEVEIDFGRRRLYMLLMQLFKPLDIALNVVLARFAYRRLTVHREFKKQFVKSVPAFWFVSFDAYEALQVQLAAEGEPYNRRNHERRALASGFIEDGTGFVKKLCRSEHFLRVGGDQTTHAPSSLGSLRFATRGTVRKAFALNSSQCVVGTLLIVNAKGLAVVMAEVKFVNVALQVGFADVVIRPDKPALQEREESLHRVRVDVAAHVLFLGVIHAAMRGALPLKAALAIRAAVELEFGD